MKVTAEFVISAASARDLPQDGLPEVALVGRSNVGKSSLINALVRQRVARTSAAPGKTRLANIYRVARGAAPPLYLVDLPGYGYARGGGESAREFGELTRAYFEFDRQSEPERRPSSQGRAARNPSEGSGLLLIDSRHPGLQSDLDAWSWLRTVVPETAVVATKIDKLARGERIRALRELESVFHEPVLPVSAVTGEGLDELWKLIDRLANSPTTQPGSRNSSPPPPRATAPPPATSRSRRPRR